MFNDTSMVRIVEVGWNFGSEDPMQYKLFLEDIGRWKVESQIKSVETKYTKMLTCV